MFPFFYNEATHLKSLSQWSVYQSIYLNSGWGPYMVWFHDCFSTSQYAPFSTQQLEQKWTGTQQEIWGSANHFQTFFSGRFDKTLILSKKRERQKKNTLKSLILRKMVMLLLLMADKCCLCVTWAERRQAICAPQLSRLQDWKQQDSKSNNYLYFLESAHTVGSCTALPDSRASALCMHYGHTASSCLPIKAYHNNITN